MPSSAGHHSPSSIRSARRGRRGFLKTSLGASAGVLAAPTVRVVAVGRRRQGGDRAARVRRRLQDQRPGEPDARDQRGGTGPRRLRQGVEDRRRLEHAAPRCGPRSCAPTCATASASPTRAPTAQAKEAFLYDRQHQSYATIAGLGPLADLYRTGAKAVTSITSAPDGTPATTIDDAVPADAPGRLRTRRRARTTPSSGQVAELVDTRARHLRLGQPGQVRLPVPAPVADERGQPGRRHRQRPTRSATRSTTPKVVVAPQLLRQRSTTPADDGGFPSGHTNAFHLAALAYAYAVPERFQELVTRAFELSRHPDHGGHALHRRRHRRPDHGHRPGRRHPRRPRQRRRSRRRRARRPSPTSRRRPARPPTPCTPTRTRPARHDPYADRDANARAVTPRLTYVLTRHGPQRAADRAEGRRGAAGDPAAVPRRGPAPRGAAHDRAALRLRPAGRLRAVGAAQPVRRGGRLRRLRLAT